MKALKLNRGVLLLDNSPDYLVFNSKHSEKKYERKISKQNFDVLKLISEEQSIDEIKASLGLSEEKVRKILTEEQTQDDRLFFEEKKKTSIEELLKLKKRNFEYKNVSNAPDLERFHKNKILDAKKQFDMNEMTMSHLFRVPTEGLYGLRYGEALAKKLIEKFTHIEQINILEIGGGLGYVSFYFLDYLKNNESDIFNKMTYTILDLSPKLQEHQKQINRKFDRIKYISANIQTYDFKDNKYDIIICNEMIADLDVEVARNIKMKEILPNNESEKIIREYNLLTDGFPEQFIFNLGAAQLILKLEEILKTDGIAYVTEYGTLDEPVMAVPLPGHFEYTIQFKHLEQISNRIYNGVELTTVYDFLNFNGESYIIANEDRETLFSCLMPFLEKPQLPAYAFDSHMLEKTIGKDLFKRIYNLKFYKLKENKAELSPEKFFALVLRN